MGDVKKDAETEEADAEKRTEKQLAAQFQTDVMLENKIVELTSDEHVYQAISVRAELDMDAKIEDFKTKINLDNLKDKIYERLDDMVKKSDTSLGDLMMTVQALDATVAQVQLVTAGISHIGGVIDSTEQDSPEDGETIATMFMTLKAETLGLN